jgi:hypothetical protein
MDADGGLMYVLPFVDVFDQIFIDYRGQDGFWYAGFTGLITRIGDDYFRTGSQQITLQCKDYTCLLDNVSLVTAWHRLNVPEQQSTLGDFVASCEANTGASKSPLVDVFTGMDKIRDIIREIIKRSQDMWTLPNLSENYGIKKVKYIDDKITDVKKYKGLSARRMNSSSSFIMNPTDFSQDFTLKETDYSCTKLVLLDEALYDMDNIFLQKMLQNTLALYKDSLKSGDSILNDLVARMLAYKYMDANGNLIIELPKYNAFPNLSKYGGRGCASVLRHEELTRNVKTGSTEEISGFTESFSYAETKDITFIAPAKTVVFGAKMVNGVIDYHYNYMPNDAAVSETTGWYTLNFHGINYVLSTDDFISCTTSIDESTLMNVASIDGLPAYLSVGSDLLNSSTYFKGVATSNMDLLAKLGVRRLQVQNLYNIDLGNGKDSSKLLSYVSSFVLERHNAGWDSGTIQLSHRPDIQLGRTFLNPLRWKLYYITGISNSWSIGGRHTTTLTVSYGHPVHQTLEQPWTAVFAEPHLFNIDNLTAPDAQGNSQSTSVAKKKEKGKVKKGNNPAGFNLARRKFKWGKAD